MVSLHQGAAARVPVLPRIKEMDQSSQMTLFLPVSSMQGETMAPVHEEGPVSIAPSDFELLEARLLCGFRIYASVLCVCVHEEA